MQRDLKSTSNNKFSIKYGFHDLVLKNFMLIKNFTMGIKHCRETWTQTTFR